MKVFISWSGERSEAVAKALREWMPLVLHYIDPWLSQSDIQAGERWSVEIAKGLESCNFGIICVTRDNFNSPWILFESGALAKSMEDGRVIPLLLDIDFKEISGPLAQFQAKKAEMVGIKDLVIGLNKVASVPVPDGQLDKLFNALWADLERQLNSVPKISNKTKQSRPQEDILEELVSSVRGVEIRVREVMDDDHHLRNRKRARVHPRMMVEFINDSIEDRSDPINILVLASVLRDDIPWFYEIALDTYRTLRAGSETEIQKASRRYLEAIELVQRGSFTRYLGIDESLLDLMKSNFFAQMEMRQRFDALKQASTDQIRMRRRPPPPPPPPSKTE